MRCLTLIYGLKYVYRRLDSNEITSLEPLVFNALTSLRHLRLDVNRLSSIPSEALAKLISLEVL